MAETYKGLTIQLGADVTQLKTALRSVDAAARTTNGNLKRLEQGLSWNPKSVQLMQMRMNELSQKAAIATSKMVILGEAANQMKARGIANLAAQTKNAEVRAASALNNYNRINDTIATMRRNLLGDFVDVLEVEQIDRIIENMSKHTKDLTDEQRRYISLLKKAQSEWSSASNELELSKQIQQYKSLEQELERTKALASSVAKEYVEMRTEMQRLGTSDGIRNIRKELQLTDEVMDKVEAEFKQLNEAMKLNPHAIETFKKSLMNTKVQSGLVADKIKQLKLHINELENAGATKTARSMAELARETQRARASVEEIKASLERAEGEIPVIIEKMRSLKSEGQQNSAEYKKLAKELAKARLDAHRFAQAMKQADNSYDAAANNEELRRTEVEIEKLTAKMKQLATMSSVAGRSFSTAFYNMRTVGMGISATVSTAATVGGMAVVNAAEEIDTAYRNMRKTVNGTEEQFEKLKKSAIEYSKTHVTSADTILEIQAMAGQLGIAVDNLDAFSKVVSNLDIATDDALDAETIAIDLGKLINVIDGLKVDNVDKFADALTRLGNNNAALESDILNITTRFGAMGSMVGMSADEILAWATAATSTGVKAESAGSNMQKTLGNINSAVAAGGKKLEQWSAVIGMSADEITKKWGDSNGGTTEVFQNFLKTLSKMDTTQVDATLQGLGIGSVRQRQLIEGLTQSVETMQDKLDMSSNAWNGLSDVWGQAGDAENEASKKTAGFTGAIETLRNSLQDLGSSIGEDLIPYINTFKDAVNTFSKWYDGLSEGSKEAMINTALFLAVLGPGLTTVGVFGQGLSKLVPAIGNVVTAIKKMIAAQKVARAATGAASASISTLASSNGKYVASVGKAAKASKAGATAAKGVATATMSFASKLGIAGVAVAALAATIYGVCKVHQDLAEDQKLLADAAAGTGDIFTQLAGSVSSSTDLIEDYSDDMADKTTKSLKEIQTGIRDTAKSMNEFSSELSDSFTKVSSDSAKLNKYMSVIEDLSGKSNLSKREMENLELAVKGVNDACGTSYEIDAETGAIKEQGKEAEVTTDSIRKLVSVQKLALQQSAMGEKLSEALNLQDQAGTALADAQKKEQEMAAAYSAAMAQFDEGSAEVMGAKEQWINAQQAVSDAASNYSSINDTVTRLTDNYGALNDAIKSGEDSISYLVMSSDETRTALESNGQSVLAFEDALSTLGVSYKNMSDDTKNNLANVAAEFDGTIGSIAPKLEEYGENIDIASMSTKDMAKVIESSANSIDTSITKAFESSTNETVNDFVTKLNEAGVGMEELASITDSQWALILSSYDGNIETAKQHLESWVDANRELGTKSANALASGIVEGEDVISTEGENLGEKLRSGFTSSEYEFNNAGYFAAIGVKSGAESGEGALYQAGVRAAAKYLQGVKDRGKQGSPWKTTIKSGKWAAEGLAIGSDKNLRMVEDSGRKAAQAAIDSINKGLQAADFSTYMSIAADVDTAVKDIKKISKASIPVRVSSDGSAISANTNIYNVNGVTYDDGTNVANAVGELIQATRLKRRS